MMRTLFKLTVWIGITVGLGACSADAVPVQAPIDPSPKSAVTMHPTLADYLLIPNDNQVYSWTPEGLLKYSFQLQNNNARQVRVRIQAAFYDSSGVHVVYEPVGDLRRVLPPSSIQNIEFICSNQRGKSIRVHIMPSR